MFPESKEVKDYLALADKLYCTSYIRYSAKSKGVRIVILLGLGSAKIWCNITLVKGRLKRLFVESNLTWREGDLLS